MSDSKTEGEPSETKDELDVKIKDLLVICNEIQDIVCKGNGVTPHWTVCVNTLQTCYERVGKSEGFRDMFVEFHKRYSNGYSTPIFSYVDDDDDGTVEDDFFTDQTIMPKPGESKKDKEEKESSSKVSSKKEPKKKGSNWGKKVVLEGPVIYFTYEDAKSTNFCIPIGEIYRVSVSLYDKMEKEKQDDSTIRSLPSRLLLAFFKVIKEACTDVEGCSVDIVITDNITVLDNLVSQLTVDGKGTTSGGPFATLKEIFKKVAPSLLGNDNKGMPKELKESISNVLKDDTLDNISEIFTEFGSTIEKGAAEAAKVGKTEGKTQSVASMLDTISGALKTESIVTKMEGIAGKLGQLTGNGNLAPPSKPPDAVESPDACEQD
jgi:hypothetical protein